MTCVTKELRAARNNKLQKEGHENIFRDCLSLRRCDIGMRIRTAADAQVEAAGN